MQILVQKIMAQLAESYSKSCQTTNTERFAKIINEFPPLITFPKLFILDVLQGSEYASDYVPVFMSESVGDRKNL